MSASFWIKLISALTLFVMAIMAVQLYKSELVRNLRARFLRRKIVPMVQSMLPLIVDEARDRVQSEADSIRLGGSYELMRLRADLEAVFRQAKPLFDQERDTIAEFLQRLSALGRQFDNASVIRQDVENAVLLGQRVVHELTEIGL